MIAGAADRVLAARGALHMVRAEDLAATADDELRLLRLDLDRMYWQVWDIQDQRRRARLRERRAAYSD